MATLFVWESLHIAGYCTLMRRNRLILTSRNSDRTARSTLLNYLGFIKYISNATECTTAFEEEGYCYCYRQPERAPRGAKGLGWTRDRERVREREEEYRHCLLRVRIETKARRFCNGFEFGWLMCALSACSSIPLHTHVYVLETSVHNACPRVDR